MTGSLVRRLRAPLALAWLALPAGSIAGAPPCRDQGIAGIRLHDVASSKATLGPLLDRISDIAFPSSGFDAANAHRTERLRMLIYPGGVDGSFDEFEATAGGAETLEILPMERFVSSCGVHLGMTEMDVMAALGKPSGASSKAGRRKLTYREGPATAFVRAAKMPGYDAAYLFEGGRLVHFAFGFELP